MDVWVDGCNKMQRRLQKHHLVNNPSCKCVACLSFPHPASEISFTFPIRTIHQVLGTCQPSHPLQLLWCDWSSHRAAYAPVKLNKHIFKLYVLWVAKTHHLNAQFALPWPQLRERQSVAYYHPQPTLTLWVSPQRKFKLLCGCKIITSSFITACYIYSCISRKWAADAKIHYIIDQDIKRWLILSVYSYSGAHQLCSSDHVGREELRWGR